MVFYRRMLFALVYPSFELKKMQRTILLFSFAFVSAKFAIGNTLSWQSVPNVFDFHGLLGCLGLNSLYYTVNAGTLHISIYWAAAQLRCHPMLLPSRGKAMVKKWKSAISLAHGVHT